MSVVCDEANTASRAYSEAEWRARCDLAALCRIAAIYEMSDLIYNHISLRIPGASEHLLINPFGLLFNRITATSLVKIDLSGNLVDSLGRADLRINRAGVVLHTAVHKERPEMDCVIHSHTTAGMAVSAQKDGLLPITQHAMMFHGRVGYHDYESFATNSEEQQRIARDLGDNEILVLRKHGMLIAGRSVGEAFHSAYHLERACQAQLMAQSGGVTLHFPSASVARLTADRMATIPPEHYEFFWKCCLDLLPDRGAECRC